VQAAENTKRVLLVDDDRQQFLLIGYLLSEAHYDDYRLVWCQDLERGLTHIENQQCDVVLLDYHWGINCKDFIRRSRELNDSIPVIVMTDDTESEVDRTAISEGASDYLVKETINSEILERTVRYSMERKKIEHHLNHLAHYDYLTNLPNRVLFLDRLSQAISLAQRSSEQFTVMYIDLNDFKAVNDNHGHDMGDKLLREFAERLQKNVRRSDTVARIGGDEFTILLNHMGSKSKIISLAQKLIDSVEQPFVMDNINLSIGCSIGIAVFPDAGDNIDLIQKNADMAMYQAKQTGTNCYRFFIQQPKDNVFIENLSPDQLHQIITDRKLTISYTPRVDLASDRLLGVAISPVWDHKDLGLQYYKQFASLLQNTETIKMLTEWMINESLVALKDICKTYPLVISYAIRRPQLQSSKFSLYVKHTAEKYNIKLQDLDFTFLRKKECGQDDGLKECIENINNIGANFSLHDFGENTLSLTHLHAYNIPSLHFSPRFLNSAIKNKKDGLLLESLVLLAHGLDRKVVVDGLGKNADVALMKSIGCDFAEGGVIGEHLSYSELLVMLKTHNASLNA
jgi:diguanylate cyclase (GGDEF)-like protein